VSHFLHARSPRAAKPLVRFNCAAIPAELAEAELFGHSKGAFTGATSARRGFFAEADGGTLVLDEIGELTLPVQAKLLRALQEGEIQPVGSGRVDKVDVRVVAATNRELEEEVARGAFRQDLYYRLNVIEVRLPPLRQRREDIPLLVEHFVRRFATEQDKEVLGVTPEALQRLEEHEFPGNVRELENVIERAVALTAGPMIDVDVLPALRVAKAPSDPIVEFPADGVDLDRLMADYERAIVQKALEKAGGVRKRAAQMLGISFRSLRYRLEKLGFDKVGDTDDDA
jgi:two-component system response regulator PilR (NtrC family)